MGEPVTVAVPPCRPMMLDKAAEPGMPGTTARILYRARCECGWTSNVEFSGDNARHALGEHFKERKRSGGRFI